MKKKISCFIILMLLLLSTNALVKSQVDDTPFFTINLMIPETMSSRIFCADVIKTELLKIGINISSHIKGWGEIGSRTWSYPLIEYDYIPTYENGGFDALITGHYSPIDLDLSGIFETSALIPFADNFYQYINTNYDSILLNYLYEQNPTERSNYAKQLQAILYEDLPAICLYYNHTLMAKRDDVTGIDPLLLINTNHRAENWDDSSDNILKYAINGFFADYNLFKEESYFDMLWMQPIYGGLFQRNPLTHLWEPVIARNYSTTPNKLSITVDLDPNAKFSDGSQVLAEDVKYSYELLMSPVVGSTEFSYLNSWFASNDSIEIMDTDTVKFTFTSVSNFPLRILSYGIIDKSLVESEIATHGMSLFDEVPLTGNVQDTLVRSCGPFKLDSFDNINDIAKLVPNTYWSDLAASGAVDAKLSELYVLAVYGKENTLTELSLGNIDVMDHYYIPSINKTDLLGLTGISGVEIKKNHHTELAINLRHPILGTGELTPEGTVEAAKSVRKAISHSIPRQIFVDTYFDGIGSAGITPVPDGCVGFDTNLSPYAYDLTLAEFYMEAAGYVFEEETTPEPTPTPTEESTFSEFIIFFMSFLGISYLLNIKRKRR